MTTYFKTISPVSARELILAHRVQGWGRTFSVAWIRRTDSKDGKRLANTLECVTGRFGVTRHLQSRILAESLEGTGISAGGPSYNRAKKNLFCLWAISRKHTDESGKTVTESVSEYRCVPFDTIRWLKVDGMVYKVDRSPPPQY